MKIKLEDYNSSKHKIRVLWEAIKELFGLAGEFDTRIDTLEKGHKNLNEKTTTASQSLNGNGNIHCKNIDVTEDANIGGELDVIGDVTIGRAELAPGGGTFLRLLAHRLYIKGTDENGYAGINSGEIETIPSSEQNQNIIGWTGNNISNRTITLWGDICIGGTSILSKKQLSINGDILVENGYIDANIYKVYGTPGATGSFTDKNGKIITVVNGLIVGIV